MLYPKIGRNRSVTLNIPDFSGGIDASKPAQDIQDNQAVSLSNMWLKDGTMQTRPALKVGSKGAILKSDFDLYDIGVDLKYGYTLYNSAGAMLANTVQESGKLFRCDKSFFLYSYEFHKFIPIEISFDSETIQTAFIEGNIENEHFFENGTLTQKLYTGVDANVSDYIEVVHSKIYGYINVRPSVDEDITRLFAHLAFSLVNGIITVQIKLYDLEGTLPTEYTPFNPTVIIGSGTSIENMDDFNLLTDAFKQQVTVNKGLEQYTQSVKPDSTEAASLVSYFVGTYGGALNHNLGDGSDAYGNSFFNKRINYNFSEVLNAQIEQIVVYGKFQFGYWKAKYIENGTTIYGDTIADGYYVDALSGFFVYATATKLVIDNITGKDGEKCQWTYYDSNGKVVNPTKPDSVSGDRMYVYINHGMSVECTNKTLSIWFPTNYYSLKTYTLTSSGKYSINEFENSFPAAGIYVEEIQIFQSVISKENRADLIIKNPLKTTFGGTNSGYNSGTRLFVAGNPEHKNVLRWSAVNDFSYFLENNFTYIGRDDEEITALAKQDGYLVVFKERELYAVEYASSTDSNNELVVYFPVTPISPYIGCDCPQSIQFIANRLTWLTSGGKVYTLYSENSYSERNVREISKHIENELKKHTKEELKAAKSADYNGNYMLFIDKTVYIWNYDANPLYNYTSSERAQQNLCWFKWDFPYPVAYVCENNGELTVICNDGTDYQGYVLDYSEDADDTVGADDTIPITSTYKSKLWDFGSPFTFKRISRALFEVQTANDGEIKVYFCTEKGREPIPAILNAQYTTTENTTHTTRPHLARVRSMGFELESDIAVKLYSAAVSAEIYGEVK